MVTTMSEPHPSTAEQLRATYAPEWDIWRDVRPGGRHGDWIAQRPGDTEQLRAKTVPALAALLAECVTAELAAARLAAIKVRLEAFGHKPTLEDGVLTVTGAAADDGPLPTVTITCKPWKKDGGLMYLWVGDRPFAEVSTPAMLADAALHLHRELAPWLGQA